MAAFEVHRQTLILMHTNKLATKQQLIDAVDLALQQVERYQMAGNAHLADAARAARIQLSGLLLQCQKLSD